MLKPISQTVNKYAERFGGRERLNDTLAYRAYLAVRFPRHAKLIRAERRFYADLLDRVGARLVFDVGAHSGNKAALLASIADRVICIEPSPGSIEILKRRFVGNPKIVVEATGLASYEGTATFHVFEETSGLNTFSEKWMYQIAAEGKSTETVTVPLTTLDRLIAAYGRPNYIKIAAEGFELEVIKGLSTPVSLINFECNLPTFASETLEIIDRLVQLTPRVQFNYCVDESPTAFNSGQWLSPDQIRTVVRSHDFRFIEIYSYAS